MRSHFDFHNFCSSSSSPKTHFRSANKVKGRRRTFFSFTLALKPNNSVKTFCFWCFRLYHKVVLCPDLAKLYRWSLSDWLIMLTIRSNLIKEPQVGKNEMDPMSLPASRRAPYSDASIIKTSALKVG